MEIQELSPDRVGLDQPEQPKVPEASLGGVRFDSRLAEPTTAGSDGLSLFWTAPEGGYFHTHGPTQPYAATPMRSRNINDT